MGDFRTSSASWKLDQPTENWNDVVYVKKLLYPNEMWFNITNFLLLDGKNSSLAFFFFFSFRKFSTMEISSLHWAFESHKEHATRTTQWMVPPHVKVQYPDELATSLTHTSELGLLEPVNTEVTGISLWGGAFKGGAWSTSHPSSWFHPSAVILL